MSSKGLFYASYSNLSSAPPPGIVVPERNVSATRVRCDLSVMPIVIARTDALRTYRATLTERERAGRLFLAFSTLHRGSGVGFETGALTATLDRRDQQAPGFGVRLDCTAEDDVKTTCLLEVRAPA